MTSGERLRDLAGELDRIGETLTEILVEELREAVESERGEKPVIEKPVSQARRAIEKAVRHLHEAADRVE